MTAGRIGRGPLNVEDRQGNQMRREGKAPQAMQIGEFAEKAGLSVRAVRYYEELGLLEPEGHSQGGFRLYGVENAKRIQVINFLKELGLSLEEIRDILLARRRYGGGQETVGFIQQALRQKLGLVEDKLAVLQRMKHELESTLRILSDCECCDREVLLEGTSCAGCPNLTPPDAVPGTFEVFLK